MADVNASLANWSTTRASNSPSGGAVAGAGIDDNLRELQGVVRGWLAYIGADISVASTMDLGAVEGSTHNTIGTGTVTSFGTISAGMRKRLVIGGATTTVTHNATSLIIPGALSLSLVQGDVIDCESLGGGNWRIVGVTRVSGKPAIANLASEVTSSAVGRVTAVNVNTAITQLETLASPGYTWISVTGTNTLTGTANALFTTSVSTGELFRFMPQNTNTGTVVLNVNATGARDVVKNGVIPLTPGDLLVGVVHELHYDGTRFQVLNPGVPNITGLVTSDAVTIGGALTVGGAITAGASVTVPNATGYIAKDSAATPRTILSLDASDITTLAGSAGGFKLTTNNGATTALQVSNTGKINAGSLRASTAEFQTGESDVFVTPAQVNSHKRLARAWMLLDGVAGLVTASEGFSGVTKNATGDYTLTFTSAMNDTDYVVLGSGRGTYFINEKSGGVKTTTQIQIAGARESGGTWPLADDARISIAIFGN